MESFNFCKNRIVKMGLLMGLLLIGSIIALGDTMFSFHNLFSDHMVLQRDKEIAVFGFSSASAEVTVTFLSKKVVTKADENGRWVAYLPKQSAGGPYILEAASEGIILTVNDVYIGEVWLAGGQSNMEVKLNEGRNAEYEEKNADYPLIRMFKVERAPSDTLAENVKGQWDICTPESMKRNSAVPYMFARELYKYLNVPIGVVNNSVGGTCAEYWVPYDYLAGNPMTQPILDRWEKKENKSDLFWRPGGLYNGMVAPLAPFTFKGIIWWQGGYNAEKCEQFGLLSELVILGWRKLFGDIPFIYAGQPALDIRPQPNPAKYDELRDAQLKVFKKMRKDKVGMAVTFDLSDPHDIHNPNTQATANRMGIIAKNITYGASDKVYYGPTYNSFKVKGNKIIVSFDDVGSGLFLRKVGATQGYEVAGDDQAFHEAYAKIEGKNVVVWSDMVEKPVAARYAFADNPVASLYNLEGFAASPFRTDNWKLKTDGLY